MAMPIVESSNITGNIGSCKTEVSIINGYERPSLFWQKDVGYATNNCTGKTDVYYSWSLTGTSIFLLVCLGIVAIIALGKIILKALDRWW